MTEMGRKLGLGLALIALGACAASADHIPPSPSLAVAYEPLGRIIAEVGPFNPYLEILGRWNDPSPGFAYRSLSIGGYYRPIPNLKIGAFYRLQAGARHNDDWVQSGPGWIWQDTTERYEQLLVLDASPRFLLPHPLEDAVVMLKSRWAYNFFDGEQSLMVRPGITYFILRDGRPLAEIAMQYAAYLALNFGERLLYAQTPYLELLYHLAPELQLSLGAGLQMRSWTTSSEVLAVTGDHYTVGSRTITLQVGLIYRPGF
jgi:hypothetical protein